MAGFNRGKGAGTEWHLLNFFGVTIISQTKTEDKNRDIHIAEDILSQKLRGKFVDVPAFYHQLFYLTHARVTR